LALAGRLSAFVTFDFQLELQQNPAQEMLICKHNERRHSIWRLVAVHLGAQDANLA